MNIEQIEIFASVTKQEKEVTRALLELYPKMRTGYLALERRAERTEKQENLCRVCRQLVEDIDRAMDTILDDEVRVVLKERYFHSRKYKTTVLRFGNMGTRTVDRRIDAGVETIASYLKLIDYDISTDDLLKILAVK